MITMSRLELENNLEDTNSQLEYLKNTMDTKVRLKIQAQKQVKSYRDSVSLDIEAYNELLRDKNEILKQLSKL